MPFFSHALPGLASKWVDARIPLWASLFSVYFLDIPNIMYSVFGGLDSRAAVPWTHSLFMAAVLSVAAGLVAAGVAYFRGFGKSFEKSRKSKVSQKPCPECLQSEKDIKQSSNFLLKKPSIKEGVVIAKYVHSPQFNLGHIEINAKFKETVPDFLHFWLRPKETEPTRPKGFLARLLKH